MQGTTALAIDRPQAWTEICSTQLLSLGSVGESVSFQLYMEESTPSFGDVRVLLRAPSLGLWNAELPPVSIHNKAPGAFHNISSALGAHSGPLSSNYTDLRICVAINAESGRYVLDDLRFSGITASATTTTTSTTDGGGTTGSGGTQGTTSGDTSTTGGGTGTTTGSGGTGGGDGGTGGMEAPAASRLATFPNASPKPIAGASCCCSSRRAPA